MSKLILIDYVISHEKLWGYLDWKTLEALNNGRT